MHYLICFTENQIEKSVRLPDHAILIGRSSSCDLTLSDPAISRRHCRLSPVGDKILFEDLDSANGSYMDGSRIRRRELGPGSRLVLGAYSVKLTREPATGYSCRMPDCPSHGDHLFRRAKRRQAKQGYLQILVLDPDSGLYYCESCFLDVSCGRTGGKEEDSPTTEVSSLLG